jgi:hypothetical protein
MIAEAPFKWFLFFSIGIAYICNAVFHVIFRETAAHYIGCVDKSVQSRVDFASFVIGFVGVLATWRSFDMHCQISVGAAHGIHIHSMITEHNFKRAAQA